MSNEFGQPAPGNAVKIYFCDICNQSIPLKDIEDGVAVASRGKMICSVCNAASNATKTAAFAQTSAAPAPQTVPAERSNSSFGRDLLLVAVAVAGGAGLSWYLQKQEWNKYETKLTNDLTAVRGEQSTLASRLDSAKQSFERLQSGIDDLSRQLKAEEDVSAARTRKATGEFDARFEQVKAYVSENERSKDQIQQLEMRTSASTEVISNLQKELSQLRGTMIELAGIVAKVGSAPPAVQQPADQQPADVNPTPAAPMPLGALPNDLQGFAKKLKSTDAAERWDAVDQLGRSRDARVVPYVVSTLKDTDDFVRQISANVLGDLTKAAKPSVPFLIDALSDEKPFVREAVAQSLRKITDQNLKFDTFGKKEDRVKQQDAWRKWWAANGDK